jgi:hypothetical protein
MDLSHSGNIAHPGRETETLTAPAPKAADGKPDLSGLWHRLRTLPAPAGPGDGPNREDFMRPGEKTPPQLPAVEALYRQRQVHGDRRSRLCLPRGIPDRMLIGAPLEILQNPGLTLIL